jgi:Ca2+-binding RTX toxin-like protein
MPGILAQVHGTNRADRIVRDASDPDANIKALGGNDVVIGNFTSERIHLGAGHDLARARSGHDELFGNAGSDRLHGGAGMDVIWATGNERGDVDTVVSGAGRDMIYGDGGPGRVVVTDFTTREDHFIFTGTGEGRLGVDVLRTEVEFHADIGMWEVTRAVVQHGEGKVDFHFTDGPMQAAEPDTFDLNETYANTLLGGPWWV